MNPLKHIWYLSNILYIYIYTIFLPLFVLYNHEHDTVRFIIETCHKSTIIISLKKLKRESLRFLHLFLWGVFKPKSLLYFKLYICFVVYIFCSILFLFCRSNKKRLTRFIFFSLVCGKTQSHNFSFIYLLTRQSVCYANPKQPVLT